MRGRRGLLISFEGIEGSGKSTQLMILARRLRAEGLPLEVVREPGGTPLGEAMRRILLAPPERDPGDRIDPRAELFLYLAARSQLVARVIAPALAAGRIVLADRFGDASVAYQGGGRRLGAEDVASLVRFATAGLAPDRTYLLDLPPEIGLRRARQRGQPDRLEAEAMPFHRRVRAVYRAIAAAEPERVRLVRADGAPERIAERIARDVDGLLACLRPGPPGPC